MTVPAVADDAAVTKLVIADYEEATTEVRVVAKWLVTSGVAVAALLVGTAPLAGIGDLPQDALFPAGGFAALTLLALGVLVFFASQVLAPRVAHLEEIAQDAGYKNFRTKVNAAPDSFLGGHASTLKDFLDLRTQQYKDEDDLSDDIQDPDTASGDLDRLRRDREKVRLNIRRIAWTSERLIAAAGHAVTWRRFTIARWVSAVSVLVSVVGIAGFLMTVGTAKSAAADAAFSGPLPVRVALSDAGRATWGSLLGETCPTTDFQALLTEGGQSAPWSLMVTDTDCTTGVLELTAAQGAVLVRSASG